MLRIHCKVLTVHRSSVAYHRRRSFIFPPRLFALHYNLGLVFTIRVVDDEPWVKWLDSVNVDSIKIASRFDADADTISTSASH